MDGALSKRLVGRMAAALFVASGLVTAASPLLPTAPGVERAGVVAVGAVAVLVGLVVWALPWQRWPRAASLGLVPFAFALIALHNHLAAADPYRYGLFFVVAFTWLGIAHPPGTALRVAPLLAVAYLVPLWTAGRASAAAVASVAYAVPVCVLVGEALARVSARLGEAQAELLRRQEEAHFHALLGRSSEAIALLAPDGTVRYASPSVERVLGYAPEELVGRNGLELVPPEDRALVAAKLTEVAARPGETVVVEHGYRHKDGARRWLESTLTNLLAEPGVGAIVANVRDVTERKQAEAGLGQLASIVEGSVDAILSWTLDGTITTWNGGAERLYGYSGEEVVGRHVSMIVPPERAAELPRLTERLERGERVPSFETVRLRKDGTPLDVSITLSPIRDPAGRVVGASSIARDIGARKRAEEAQRFLAEATAALVASLDYEATLTSVARLAVPALADWCAVNVVEEDGSVRRVALAHADPAKEALAGQLQERYRVNPAAPRGPGRVLRTGDVELVPDVSDAWLAAAARDAGHLALLRAIGVRSYMCVPLVARGNILGALSFIAGESGRRYGPDDLALAEHLARRAALAVDNARLYRQAQDAIRARDQFLSIAAHELRTPVAGIKGYAQLLRRSLARGAPDAGRLAKQLGTIAVAADRLTALTNDLLDVSQLRLGQLPLRREPLDLAAFVRDLADRYRAHLDAAHPLVVDLAEAPCPVSADPGRLEQVLTNLLDNAVKYSPDGGEVRLELRPDGAGGLLVVRDRGIGLPPGAAETIFEPFGRAPNAAEQHLPGLGLGLYICRSIVERHGGRIWAESAGEGCGTTVSLWLPCHGEDGAAEPGEG